MWGFAQLYDQAHFRRAFSSPQDLALTAGAYSLLAFPTSLPLLALTGAASAAALFGDMPVHHHHQYFSGLTGVAVALGAAAAARGGDRERLLFAPVRWMTVLLYLLSSLHKMNPEFFRPDTGCGQQFLSRGLGLLGLSVGSSGVVPIAGGSLGVAVELAIPLLLVRRQTRLVGVGLGALFHLAMAALGYARFSALMLALLVLFLDVGRLERFLVLPRSGLRAIRSGLIVGGIALAAWMNDPSGHLPAFPFWRLDLALTGFATGACFVVAVLTGFLRGGAAQRGALRLAPAGALGPALVLASGLSPYVGLGTLHSFSMYSNLKTEGPHRNHAFLGPWLEVFGYQRDLVEIHSSNVPELQDLADRRWTIPWVGFVRLVQRHAAIAPRVTVAYARDGQVREVPDAARDPELTAPLSLFERKLVGVRPIELEGPRLCTF
jgi:hypothetical protein